MIVRPKQKMENFLHNSFIAGRRLAYALMYFAGRFSAVPASASVLVLCYHNIGPDSWYHSVSREKFLAQLDYLMDNFQPILPTELKNPASGRPSFLLTFDDGYQGVMNIRQDIRQRNLKPILFIMADNDNLSQKDLYGVNDFLSREQVKELLADGWSLGCHSLSHKNVRGLDDDGLYKEIGQAKQKLEDDYGVSVDFFAYPNGRYDEKAIAAVKQAGYQQAFSMDDGYWTKDSDPYRVPRTGLNRSLSFLEFKSALLPLNMRARKMVKKIFLSF